MSANEGPVIQSTHRRRTIIGHVLIAIGVAPIVILLHEYAHAVAQLLGGAGSSTVRALSGEQTVSCGTTSRMGRCGGPAVLARLGAAVVGRRPQPHR